MERVITVKRKLPFNHEQKEELEDWFESAYTSIGSYYEDINSIKVASGLTFNEEKLLLPEIIGVAAEDKIQFMQKRNEYYYEIDTPIPSRGLKLKISLEDNTEKLSENNKPIDVGDYLKYRHLVKHPEVAFSKEEGERNPIKKYWIEDPLDIIKMQQKANKIKDEAIEDYLNIKSNKDKIERVLIGMGVNPDKQEDKLGTLRELAEKKPARFHEVANDPDLDIQYELEKMIQAGILQRVGQRFVFPDTTEEVAGDMKEMILWMKDKKNSKDVNILRIRLREHDNPGDAHKDYPEVSGTKKQQKQEHTTGSN